MALDSTGPEERLTPNWMPDIGPEQEENAYFVQVAHPALALARLARNCNLLHRQINSKHDSRSLSTNVVSIAQRFSDDPMLCTTSRQPQPPCIGFQGYIAERFEPGKLALCGPMPLAKKPLGGLCRSGMLAEPVQVRRPTAVQSGFRRSEPELLHRLTGHLRNAWAGGFETAPMTCDWPDSHSPPPFAF
ncbi:hypothetical protein B0T21DRAFT_343766 [Apiosordaria backusii]|uniref:Uncharacterized protein n=1 Tax=Apiosordaria backusii TaxID=314023 RepID=A0AA40EYU1_9PEZI|nr:hypothetical protein B0T21DRAFT_343766 [Apiosordaria backusii]